MKGLFDHCGKKVKMFSWYYLAFGIGGFATLWIFLSQFTKQLADPLQGLVEDPNYNVQASILTVVGFYVFIAIFIFLLLFWLFRSKSTKMIGYEETIEKENLDLTSPVGLSWRTGGKAFMLITVFLVIFRLFITIVQGHVELIPNMNEVSGIPSLQEAVQINQTLVWINVIVSGVARIFCFICIGYLLYGHGEKKLVEEFEKEQKQNAIEA